MSLFDTQKMSVLCTESTLSNFSPLLPYRFFYIIGTRYIIQYWYEWSYFRYGQDCQEVCKCQNGEFSPSCERKYRYSFAKVSYRKIGIFAQGKFSVTFSREKKKSRKINIFGSEPYPVSTTMVYRYTFRGGPGNCRTLGKWTNINIRKGKPPHVEKLTPFYFIFW